MKDNGWDPDFVTLKRKCSKSMGFKQATIDLRNFQEERLGRGQNPNSFRTEHGHWSQNCSRGREKAVNHGKLNDLFIW